ncbi:MAG: GNAT family N-acetyltransferase [Flammeovirgaceae bacterium]
MSNTKANHFVSKYLSRVRHFFSTRDKSVKADTFIIQQQPEVEGQGKFFIAIEGEELAFLAYTNLQNKVLTLNHTDVSDKLKGKGVGKKLIEASVNFAREKQMKVVPNCPYAQTIFNKNPDFKTVLKSW